MRCYLTNAIRNGRCRRAVLSILLALAGVPPAQAQLNTQHIKGTVGLKAGSQPPPGIYVVAPLIYVYSTDTVKNADGDKLPLNADLTTGAYAAGVSLVTTKKIFGGFYGAQIIFPVGVNNRIQGTEIDENPGAGVSDSVLQPISLGWHFERTDVMTGYTIFVPTGRYADGATNNTGLGMWGHELSVGATVYLTKTKQYHAATLASFDFQSKKENSNNRVGPTMILEGGVGGDFVHGGVTAGLAYYSALKLGADDIEGLPGILIRGKNKVFAVGPEVTMALARGGTLYGFLKVNYEWEVYARTTTQGSELTILATFPLKPIKIPSH